MRSWGVGELKEARTLEQQGGFLSLGATDSGEKEVWSAWKRQKPGCSFLVW